VSASSIAPQPQPLSLEQQLDRLVLPAAVAPAYIPPQPSALAHAPQHPRSSAFSPQPSVFNPQPSTQYPQYPTQYPQYPARSVRLPTLPPLPPVHRWLWRWAWRHPGYAALLLVVSGLWSAWSFNPEFRSKVQNFQIPFLERAQPENLEIPNPDSSPTPSPSPEAPPPTEPPADAPNDAPSDPDLIRDLINQLRQPTVP
jgi:hypothetical protein